MKTLKEFFKNRGSFISLPRSGLRSEEMFSPEVYSLYFLKEKVKPICHFLVSISPYTPIFINIYITDNCENYFSGRSGTHHL